MTYPQVGKGLFIALEGGEGTGKSTQAGLLVEALGKAGRDVVHTREPGGTEGAEAIRKLLLDPPAGGWGIRAEALLFAAARADHVDKLIGPALAAGKWVVCDRFIDSSRAYQGHAGSLGDELIRQLHLAGSTGLRPDMTLLFDVSDVNVAERLMSRDRGKSDAIGGRNPAFHARVREGFRNLADGDDSVIIIDGNGAPELVHRSVMAALKPFLEERD